jgi:hypothetical protein
MFKESYKGFDIDIEDEYDYGTYKSYIVVTVQSIDAPRLSWRSTFPINRPNFVGRLLGVTLEKKILKILAKERRDIDKLARQAAYERAVKHKLMDALGKGSQET